MTTSAIIFFSQLDQGMCYNPQLLDSLADSFNERIWVGASIPTKLIQKNLDFLQDEDAGYIEKYTRWNSFDSCKEMLQNKSSPFSNFYHSCREIYDNHAEIDPLTQAAVQMMFERVSQKYEQHLNFLASTNHLLPTKKALAKDSSKDTHAVGEKSNDNSQSLPEISIRHETGSANPHQRLVTSH